MEGFGRQAAGEAIKGLVSGGLGSVAAIIILLATAGLKIYSDQWQTEHLEYRKVTPEARIQLPEKLESQNWQQFSPKSRVLSMIEIEFINRTGRPQNDVQLKLAFGGTGRDSELAGVVLATPGGEKNFTLQRNAEAKLLAATLIYPIFPPIAPDVRSHVVRAYFFGDPPSRLSLVAGSGTATLDPYQSSRGEQNMLRALHFIFLPLVGLTLSFGAVFVLRAGWKRITKRQEKIIQSSLLRRLQSADHSQFDVAASGAALKNYDRPEAVNDAKKIFESYILIRDAALNGNAWDANKRSSSI